MTRDVQRLRYEYERSVFGAWDFWVGVVSGGMAAIFATNGDIQQRGVLILLAEASFGAALLGIVLAALAVFATLFDEYYRRILAATSHGVKGAFFPYQVVAAVGALAAGTGLFGALVWAVLPSAARAGALGIVTLFAFWAAAATVRLVNTTVFHGVKRAELLGVIDEARDNKLHRKTA